MVMGSCVFITIKTFKGAMKQDPLLTEGFKMDRFSVICKEAASKNNLTCRQIAILSFVYEDNMHKSVIDYSRKLQINKPAVTRALDRLEELNLIQRNTSEADRRMIFVTPTENGQKYFDNLISNETH